LLPGSLLPPPPLERIEVADGVVHYMYAGLLLLLLSVLSRPPLLSMLLPLPPLERIEAAEGVRNLHAAGSRSPPLSVLLLPPPLERVEAAGGLRRLHKAGSLLPQPSVPLPPLLERIEAARGVLCCRAHGGGGRLDEAARGGLRAAATELAVAAAAA